MAQEGLQIRQGGKVIRTRWKYDEESQQGSYVEDDVTERAVTLLFDDCTLEDGVILRDIFLLLNTELDIFDTIITNWCKEIVTEGLTKPKEAARETEIEFLELYWRFYKDVDRDTKKTFLGGNIFPQFHGMGFVHKEDHIVDGILHSKAGERTGYSIALTPASELMDIPVRFSEDVCIYNEDNWSEQPQKFDSGQYSLGQILYAVIWELSFYGGPEKRDQTSQELMDSVDEIKNGNLSDLLSEKEENE